MPTILKQSDLPIWFEDLTEGSFDQNRIYKLYGTTESFEWTDLESSINCSSQYHNLALTYIKKFLGYFPNENIYLPHMAFIQTLLEKSETKQMDVEMFWQEMTEQMKLLRNDDMRKSGWLSHVWPKEDYRNSAQAHLAQHKQAARQRLTDLLGFEPKLKYSFEAELLLRTLFEEEHFTPDLPFGDKDFNAATAVLYRMHYFESGEAVADQSHLIALSHDPFALSDFIRAEGERN